MSVLLVLTEEDGEADSDAIVVIVPVPLTVTLWDEDTVADPVPDPVNEDVKDPLVDPLFNILPVPDPELEMVVVIVARGLIEPVAVAETVLLRDAVTLVLMETVAEDETE